MLVVIAFRGVVLVTSEVVGESDCKLEIGRQGLGYGSEQPPAPSIRLLRLFIPCVGLYGGGLCRTTMWW